MNPSALMGTRVTRSVEQSSTMLKNLYYIEREIMRTLAGYLVSISSWEFKKKVPEHLWQDSLRAEALRSRVLELRYPRRDVDQNQDQRLVTFLSLPIRSSNDREFAEAVYFVTKRYLLSAYELYLSESDPLDDAPTHKFMSQFPNEIRQQISEIEAIYSNICSIFPEATEWSAQLESFLNKLGGFCVNNTADLPADLVRPEYTVPTIPNRDPRFISHPHHMPSRSLGITNFLDQQIGMGINHANEIWASEVLGTCMWSMNSMPWDFYTDCARWCYDELRHCIMGETRLKAWGFEPGADYPIANEFYTSVSKHGSLALLAFVHYCEQGAGEWKSGLMRDFTAEGDMTSVQDFDYDWADESIHLMYGHKWLSYLFKEDHDQLFEYVDTIGKSAEAYLKALQEGSDYEPFFSRIRDKLEKLG